MHSQLIPFFQYLTYFFGEKTSKPDTLLMVAPFWVKSWAKRITERSGMDIKKDGFKN
jgi:hypothetical protein